MAPVTNKASPAVVIKRSSDTETDEGFHSPSASRAEGRCENGQAEVSNGSTSSASDSDGQQEPASHAASCGHTQEANVESCSQREAKSRERSRERDSVEKKAASLAKYVVFSLVEKTEAKSNDKVEETLLRCVKMMMHRHEILFKGMMKRFDITRETGYVSFVAVANELFEGGKMAITWARIVALYAFGGQLALYCKEKNIEDFNDTIATFMGTYASEVIAPFVRKAGGWIKICEEFPAEEDMESKAWRYLTWTAIGLGLAATASFFTSH
ncbi:induced myeloid leukemia cell differentiation protein Mcl-1 homolog [Procambarus clarkii]